MKRTVAVALLLVPEILFVVSCSRPPEQQFLTQFFRAPHADQTSHEVDDEIGILSF